MLLEAEQKAGASHHKRVEGANFHDWHLLPPLQLPISLRVNDLSLRSEGYAAQFLAVLLPAISQLGDSEDKHRREAFDDNTPTVSYNFNKLPLLSYETDDSICVVTHLVHNGDLQSCHHVPVLRVVPFSATTKHQQFSKPVNQADHHSAIPLVFGSGLVASLRLFP